MVWANVFCELSILLFCRYIQPSSTICLEGALTETGFDETPSELRVFCNVHDGTTVNSPANNGTSTVRLHDDGGFRSIYCKLTLPEDAETLSLAYGRGTTRYAYHGSTDNDCGVSFPKPPRRSEVGLWKCMNTMSDGRFYGGFVFVASPNDTKSKYILCVQITVECPEKNRSVNKCVFNGSMNRIKRSIKIVN